MTYESEPDETAITPWVLYSLPVDPPKKEPSGGITGIEPDKEPSVDEGLEIAPVAIALFASASSHR